MKQINTKRKTIATYKSRFIRGSSYLGIFLSLFSVAGLSKLLGIDISVFILIIITAVGYFGGCYLIGYIDDIKGIWKEENDYMYEVFPEADKQKKQIEYIYNYIKNQEEMKIVESNYKDQIPTK